jgi:hypothetical protein
VTIIVEEDSQELDCLGNDQILTFTDQNNQAERPLSSTGNSSLDDRDEAQTCRSLAASQAWRSAE